MRIFDCLLGGRDGWSLALAHEVLGLCDHNCLQYLLDRCDLSLCLQARPRFARDSAVALIPSTAGSAALGLLRGWRVCCLSSCSLASSHQSAHSLLALSESAFARERAADLSDTPLVSYSGSSFLNEDQRELLPGVQAPRALLNWLLWDLDGHVYRSTETLNLSAVPWPLARPRSAPQWITSAIGSNTTCCTGTSTISGTVLHLWDGPLDLLNHCHLSLRLSCLDGRHLALHHY